MGNSQAAAALAHRLTRLMEAKGFRSNRAFGRCVDPENPERGRRNVLRHRSGKHMPSEAMVRVYAEVLGVRPSDLDPSLADEDEEAASVEAVLMAQVRGLRRDVRVLERHVRKASA